MTERFFSGVPHATSLASVTGRFVFASSRHPLGDGKEATIGGLDALAVSPQAGRIPHIQETRSAKGLRVDDRGAPAYGWLAG